MGLLAGHVLACSRCSLLPPAHSELSESHVRSCRATSDRVGQNAAGRPRGGWQQAVISESHPSSLSGNTGRRLPGGSLHRACAAAGQSRQARAPQKGWDFCEWCALGK